jgi:hypothetical protein
MDKKIFKEEYAKMTGNNAAAEKLIESFDTFSAENEELSFEDLDKVSGGTGTSTGTYPYTLPEVFYLDGKQYEAKSAYAMYDIILQLRNKQEADKFLKSVYDKVTVTAGT